MKGGEVFCEGIPGDSSLTWRRWPTSLQPRCKVSLAEWTRDALLAQQRLAEATNAIQQAQAKARAWATSANQVDALSESSA